MQTARNMFLIPVLLLLCGLPVQARNHPARKPKLHFQPGIWEINSVTTTPTGRVVSSQTTLCAKEQLDFWKVTQANLACKTPKTHSDSPSTLRVRVHCEYTGENLHSEILSDAVETFSDHGDSFTLDGTTTTTTTYQGIQPKQTSIRLQATARRTGPCQ